MFSRFVHDIRPFFYQIHNECDYFRRFIDKDKKISDQSRALNCINRIDTIANLLKFYLECYSILELNIYGLDQPQNKYSSFDLILKNVALLDPETEYRGVSFYCKKTDLDNDSIYVSRYYPSAIMSFLYYAHKSACLGSRIIVNHFPSCFEISYVGPPMPNKLIISVSNNSFDEMCLEKKRYNLMPEELLLFAAKKILDANGSHLSMRSELMYDRNVYIESLVCEYLNSISETERNTFIHKDIDESQYELAEKIYERMLNHQGLTYEREYLNTDLLLSDYLKYNPFRGHSLVAFEDIYMKKPIYKTSITVYYGEAKKYSISR